jgi:hypothetical protein
MQLREYSPGYLRQTVWARPPATASHPSLPEFIMAAQAVLTCGTSLWNYNFRKDECTTCCCAASPKPRSSSRGAAREQRRPYYHICSFCSCSCLLLFLLVVVPVVLACLLLFLLFLWFLLFLFLSFLFSLLWFMIIILIVTCNILKIIILQSSRLRDRLLLLLIGLWCLIFVFLLVIFHECVPQRGISPPIPWPNILSLSDCRLPPHSSLTTTHLSPGLLKISCEHWRKSPV